jgi:hypothetical protein
MGLDLIQHCVATVGPSFLEPDAGNRCEKVDAIWADA